MSLCKVLVSILTPVTTLLKLNTELQIELYSTFLQTSSLKQPKWATIAHLRASIMFEVP